MPTMNNRGRLFWVSACGSSPGGAMAPARAGATFYKIIPSVASPLPDRGKVSNTAADMAAFFIVDSVSLLLIRAAAVCRLKPCLTAT